MSSSYGRGRGRGGYRGGSRGGYRGGSGPPTRQDEPVDPKRLQAGLRPLQDTIAIPTDSGVPVHVQDVQPLASHNYVEGRDILTLAVPGSPIRFHADTPLPFATSGTFDSSLDERKALGRTVGLSPFSTTVAAVRKLKPDFDFTSVDFMGDRNNLRNICRWLDGDKLLFRIDLDALEGENDRYTVVMAIWEDQDKKEDRFSNRPDFIARTTTRVDRAWTEQHNRIITYSLGPHKLLVRSKVAARLAGRNEPRLARSSTESSSQLVSLLDGLTLSSTEPEPTPGSSAALSLKVETTSPATLVPQEDLLELRTRSGGHIASDEKKDLLLQLLLVAVPNFCLAHHYKGTFSRLEIVKPGDRYFDDIRPGAERSMRRLVQVLARIKEIAVQRKRSGSAPASLVFDGEVMRVWERDPDERRLLQAFL